MANADALEELARKAVSGNRQALDDLVRRLQDDVYGLSVRMLWNREDAEDATQEILVRVVTRLSQFDFRSQLKTWVYRVAVNYLLDLKKSPVERMHWTFERFAEDLDRGLSSEGPPPQDRSLLVEEVRIGCTLGMLQCLDRPHRVAYVLGEIFEVPGPEAAAVLEITPETFRKRLQHARVAVISFTRSHCGLASDTAACACHRRVAEAVRLGRAREDSLDFADRASSFEEALAMVRQVDEARWARGLLARRRSTSRVASRGISGQPSEPNAATLRIDSAVELSGSNGGSRPEPPSTVRSVVFGGVLREMPGTDWRKAIAPGRGGFQ